MQGKDINDQNQFERKLFVIRKRIEHSVKKLGLDDPAQFYIPSLSSRTIVYKGMLLANEVDTYYPDLKVAILDQVSYDYENRGLDSDTGICNKSWKACQRWTRVSPIL